MIHMALNEQLEAKLRKHYEPSSLIEIRYKKLDVAFKTDAHGHAVLLFIGKKRSSGKIKGERYARTLKVGADGSIIKDHWDFKGKASE
jgi:hypothetical protein